jgi:quercetin dioxygenase-like cupin family protein
MSARRTGSAGDDEHTTSMGLIHVRDGDWSWLDQGHGLSLAPLRAEANGAGTALLRFDRGARAPEHRHPGGEDLFVISGRLRVGDLLLQAGDFLHTPPGGSHDAEAEVPSVALVSVPEPIEFLEGT